ncbi:MAG: DUF4827 domain-containing protein [Dysgonomonas sp.]|nr:DUF4827 domain-containing protein [Dysgonomonas sp.]
MKKSIGLICFIIGACVLFAACSKSESYADKVKKEKNRINGFLSEHNIEVLHEYPSNGVFKSNQYYLDDSGVYINVVDSGNGTRANASKRAKIMYRFKDRMWLPAAESDTVDLNELSIQPLSFNYGVSSTYINSDYTNYSLPYLYLSPGITIPLKYVGENAIVRLIVPFRNSMGSAYQLASYSTIYYGQLEYTKIIN